MTKTTKCESCGETTQFVFTKRCNRCYHFEKLLVPYLQNVHTSVLNSLALSVCEEQARREAKGQERTDREILVDFLLLLHPEWPEEAAIQEALTDDQVSEVVKWAGACHLEASDHNITAGPCPEALRKILPDDHQFKIWRV